eukprot:589938-Pyramimonas_sp.AAC.1
MPACHHQLQHAPVAIQPVLVRAVPAVLNIAEALAHLDEQGLDECEGLVWSSTREQLTPRIFVFRQLLVNGAWEFRGLVSSAYFHNCIQTPMRANRLLSRGPALNACHVHVEWHMVSGRAST